MESIEEEKYHGYTIKIYQDEEPGSPREWDNFGKMVCFHRGYDLGDKHDMSADDLKELVAKKDVISLPLYLLDHSGIWMNTTGFSHVDPQRWDWGQVGYIYADTDMIRKNFGVIRVTDSLKRKTRQLLETEVETFNKYITGDVYGYVIEDSEGNHKDSCWGFYEKPDEVLKEAKSIVKGYPYQLELSSAKKSRSGKRSGRTKRASAHAGVRGVR